MTSKLQRQDWNPGLSDPGMEAHLRNGLIGPGWWGSVG